ncbi:MAG: hypothetical protein Q9207_007058 [Kuettlingeria erythrocarpa]
MDLYDGNIVRIQPGQPTNARHSVQVIPITPFTLQVDSSANEPTAEFDAAGTVLTKCNDGSYCCGLDATECCANGRGTKINKQNGQIILGGQITRSIASTTSTLSTGSSASTDASSATTSSSTTSSSTLPIAAGPLTTSPALPSPSPIPPSSSSPSGGAKVGIAIGIIAGVGLVSGLAFLLVRERRKRKILQRKGQGGPWQPELDAVNQFPPQEMSAHERQEGRYHMRAELPNGQGRPHELYG